MVTPKKIPIEDNTKKNEKGVKRMSLQKAIKTKINKWDYIQLKFCAQQ